MDTQFVFGDVGLMLERRTDNHCGSDTPLIHHNCVGDRREFNRHHLHSAVQPGRTYTVWVYLVAPINADVAFCSPFEFTMTVRSESEPETQWSCPEDRLPDNFNSVEVRAGRVVTLNQLLTMRCSTSARVRFISLSLTLSRGVPMFSLRLKRLQIFGCHSLQRGMWMLK